MKHNKKLIVTFLLLLMISMLSSVDVFAHEIFYEGTSPNWQAIPIVWDERVSGKVHLKMNGDYLNSDYSSYYIEVSNAWPNASTKVSVARTNFGTSKVDLATASKSYWDNRWRELSPFVLGVCYLTSTDGISITRNTVKQSSRRIRYAAILLTPYMSAYESSLFDRNRRPNHIRATMVHEIGHALGLGHPNVQYYPVNDKSIMRQGTGYEGYYTPQQHDINDLANKY
jgi:predicted Zn-dependent protease